MIKPYFETKNGVLYHGDCMDIMEGMEDNSVDLVLTDPPYGIKYDVSANKSGGSNAGGKTGFCEAKKTQFIKTNWDNCTPERRVFDSIRSISTNQIIFGGNYFVEHLQNSRCWIVWDKRTNGNFADAELAWTNFDRVVKLYKFVWNGLLQENMKEKETRVHPTQKPVGLFKAILKDFSKTDMTVLDPFLGSGTTAIACEQLNRKWIGIEREEQYCEIAAKRLSEPMQRSLLA